MKDLTTPCLSCVWKAGTWATCLVLVTCLCTACSRRAKPQAAGQRPAVPVRVANAEEKTVPVQVRVVGAIQALATISVQAQVEGTLQKVHFKDGQYVKTGICSSRST